LNCSISCISITFGKWSIKKARNYPDLKERFISRNLCECVGQVEARNPCPVCWAGRGLVCYQGTPRQAVTVSPCLARDTRRNVSKSKPNNGLAGRYLPPLFSGDLYRPHSSITNLTVTPIQGTWINEVCIHAS
jgi:hypothetical protein